MSTLEEHMSTSTVTTPSLIPTTTTTTTTTKSSTSTLSPPNLVAQPLPSSISSSSSSSSSRADIQAQVQAHFSACPTTYAKEMSETMAIFRKLATLTTTPATVAASMPAVDDDDEDREFEEAQKNDGGSSSDDLKALPSQQLPSTVSPPPPPPSAVHILSLACGSAVGAECIEDFFPTVISSSSSSSGSKGALVSNTTNPGGATVSSISITSSWSSSASTTHSSSATETITTTTAAAAANNTTSLNTVTFTGMDITHTQTVQFLQSHGYIHSFILEDLYQEPTPSTAALAAFGSSTHWMAIHACKELSTRIVKLFKNYASLGAHLVIVPCCLMRSCDLQTKIGNARWKAIRDEHQHRDPVSKKPKNDNWRRDTAIQARNELLALEYGEGFVGMEVVPEIQSLHNVALHFQKK